MTTTPLVLLLAAAGANGLLAGASLDQSIKQLPARHRIGVLSLPATAKPPTWPTASPGTRYWAWAPPC
jgi:hypothetical protein